MSKRIILGVAFLSFLLICVCAVVIIGWVASNYLAGLTPAPVSAALGQEFKVKIGGTVTLDDGLSVTFVDVPTDGRCSSCTGSFYAAIELRMKAPDKPPTKVLLKTPPLSGVEGDPAPYTIKFVRLEPQRRYPPDSVNRRDYVLTLIITKVN